MLAYLIEDVVMRARPSAPIALAAERFGSFPSLHAALSVSVYALGIALVLRKSHSRHRRRIGAFVGVAFVISIGFSRLYLGVHYPLDVLGGYLVGFGWLYWGFKMRGGGEKIKLGCVFDNIRRDLSGRGGRPRHYLASFE